MNSNLAHRPTMQRRTNRSTEAPMDFEYTHRRETTPVWASPSKRLHTELTHPAPTLSAPGTPTRPTFGLQHTPNTPFLFSVPAPQTPHAPAWLPPPSFSPAKAFPAPAHAPQLQPELHDVEMADSSTSPAAKDRDKDRHDESPSARPVSGAALRRVYRRRAREGRPAGHRRARAHADADDPFSGGESSADSSGDERAPPTRALTAPPPPLSTTTTNHYTLNMPGPSAPASDMPFRLLGYVQVAFNGALAALGVYLLVLAVVTVARDVEGRVGEYAMEIVQEIARCEGAYRANLCEQERRVPAMEAQCVAWEACMRRDPERVGRARVGMEVIGETVNSFVEPISWKTLTFVLSSLAFFTLFINSLPSLFRPPAPAPAHPHVQPMGYHAPPPMGFLPPPEWGAKARGAWGPGVGSGVGMGMGMGAGMKGEEEDAPRRRRLEDGQVAKVR